jgi:hypothetical protein
MDVVRMLHSGSAGIADIRIALAAPPPFTSTIVPEDHVGATVNATEGRHFSDLSFAELSVVETALLAELLRESGGGTVVDDQLAEVRGL